MKRRYITKSWDQHVDYDIDHDVVRGAPLTVFGPPTDPRPSGLLDADGNPILVTDELNAGFLNEEFE